jgi:nicotinate-nucleotide--dimethylbenzimidazole phosphoribosyltransferase
MVYNFLQEGAAINVLARHIGAKIVVADVGVAIDLKHPDLIVKKIGHGTLNIARGPAMSKDEAIASIEAGITLFEDFYSEGLDIAAIGEMGIANTTASTAISSIVTGLSVDEMAGNGTGMDEAGLIRKISVVNKAIRINSPNKEDPLDILSKLGGFEIGGMAGIILACASRKIPVVLDGFISTASALIAQALKPQTKEYMFAGHCSAEKGHKPALKFLGLSPVLDLNMRLGEGTGAALATGIIEASVKLMNDMATFASAGVSQVKKNEASIIRP